VVSRQIIVIKWDRSLCSQVLYLDFNCDVDNTELNLSRQCSADEIFDSWGWWKHNLVNTREYKLRCTQRKQIP